ncbi:YhcN/YlaJ family sporulation lipoprotein [Metabacillus sediminilitoris]|nr:YhcN/YlaJ family sporulation lipoprotein [Metabacillus sediminilitoris]
MKHRNISVLHIVIILMIATGCNMANNNNEKNNLNIKNVSHLDMNHVNMESEIEKLLDKEKEVSDVKVFDTDKEIFIAAEIKQMDRFRIKEIEKKLNNLIKDKYPNHNVTLSTDKKIFLELDKLEQKAKNTNMNNKDLEKEIKRIKSLSEELT